MGLSCQPLWSGYIHTELVDDTGDPLVEFSTGEDYDDLPQGYTVSSHSQAGASTGGLSPAAWYITHRHIVESAAAPEQVEVVEPDSPRGRAISLLGVPKA